jgi:hypothetical protein
MNLMVHHRLITIDCLIYILILGFTPNDIKPLNARHIIPIGISTSCGGPVSEAERTAGDHE